MNNILYKMDTNNKWKPEWRPYQWNTDADYSDVSFILFQIRQDEQICLFECLSAKISRYSNTNLSYTAEFFSILDRQIFYVWLKHI